MNVTRFEPWKLVSVLHRDANQLTADRTHSAHARRAQAHVKHWVPAVDITEEKARFVLRADVPGLTVDELKIDMDKDVLTLSGQRAPYAVEDADTVQLRERSSGEFLRRFTLPDTADGDNVSATYADGVLEVVIPKQAQIEPRRITVQAA